MPKDAYYFPHDSNARNDQRLMKVRMKYGMAGYGIYFGIIEILREAANYSLYVEDIDSIAFDLRVDKETIEDILYNYNLFKIDDELFYSKSLKRRLECLDEKKRKKIEAGRKGGLATSKKVAKPKQKGSTAKALDKIRVDKIRKDNIKDRDANFKKQVFEFAAQYDQDLLNEFYSYWSEPNKSNTKMLFELKRTFDIKRRLVTWDRNNKGVFSLNKSNGVNKKMNFKMPDGRNYIAYCSKCGKSDFYDPFNFKPELIESKCCNTIILNERAKVNA